MTPLYESNSRLFKEETLKTYLLSIIEQLWIIIDNKF